MCTEQQGFLARTLESLVVDVCVTEFHIQYSGFVIHNISESFRKPSSIFGRVDEYNVFAPEKRWTTVGGNVNFSTLASFANLTCYTNN